MKTEFRGRDNDVIENLESFLNNPIYKLEIHLGSERLGDAWFVVDVRQNIQNDYWVDLCSRKTTKKEFKELLTSGDKKSALIISPSSLGHCNFRVISTIQ